MKRTIMPVAGLVAMTTLLGGCLMQASIKPEEFGKDKTYALVSIVSSKKLVNHSSDQSGSLTGLVKAVGSEHGFTESSVHSLNASVVKIRKQFSGSNAFKLMSEKKMQNNGAFKALPSGEITTKWGVIPLTTVSAKGYANVNITDRDEVAKIGKLAKALGVDGVIVTRIDYGYGFGGVNVAGLVSAGKHKAIVDVTVIAYNREGEIVWRANAREKSDEGIPSIGEAVNFRKLRPLLASTAEQAILKLLGNLERKVTAI